MWASPLSFSQQLRLSPCPPRVSISGSRHEDECTAPDMAMWCARHAHSTGARSPRWPLQHARLLRAIPVLIFIIDDIHCQSLTTAAAAAAFRPTTRRGYCQFGGDKPLCAQLLAPPRTQSMKAVQLLKALLLQQKPIPCIRAAAAAALPAGTGSCRVQRRCPERARGQRRRPGPDAPSPAAAPRRTPAARTGAPDAPANCV
mmetsp:Transcript_17647/g.53049  ORF Transcript_17647/g.53049 Transcript_17647/m.53049 type:complete len:201 (+) Transcript_17647:1170-1772(+)